MPPPYPIARQPGDYNRRLRNHHPQHVNEAAREVLGKKAVDIPHRIQ